MNYFKTAVGTIVVGLAMAVAAEAGTIPGWVDYSGDLIIWAEFGANPQTPVTAQSNIPGQPPLSGDGKATTSGLSSDGKVSGGFSVALPNIFSEENTKNVTLKFEIKGLALAPGSNVPIPLDGITSHGHGYYPASSGLGHSFGSNVSITPHQGTATDWTAITISMTFKPQPESEEIFVFVPDVAGTPAYPDTDAVVRNLQVCSQCVPVPEPTTLMLFCVGVLPLLRRR